MCDLPGCTSEPSALQTSTNQAGLFEWGSNNSSRFTKCYWLNDSNYDSVSSHFAVGCDAQKGLSNVVQMLISQCYLMGKSLFLGGISCDNVITEFGPHEHCLQSLALVMGTWASGLLCRGSSSQANSIKWSLQEALKPVFAVYKANSFLGRALCSLHSFCPPLWG